MSADSFLPAALCFLLRCCRSSPGGGVNKGESGKGRPTVLRFIMLRCRHPIYEAAGLFSFPSPPFVPDFRCRTDF